MKFSIKHKVTLFLVLFSGLVFAQTDKTPFESAVHKAKATRDFRPLSSIFLKTDFYTVITRSDVLPKPHNELLSTYKNPGDPRSFIRISEQSKLLTNPKNGEVMKVSGSRFVLMLQQNISIVIEGLNGGADLIVDSGQVNWMRNTVEPYGWYFIPAKK